MYKKLLFSVIIFSLFVLASCSANNASQQEPLKDYDISKITGPYASRFKELYQKANTNEQREVFASGNVSKEQRLFFADKFNKCMELNGSHVNWDEYGYASYAMPEYKKNYEGVHEVMEKCNATDLEIVRLYYDLRINPYNKNIYDEIAKCFVKIGVAPDGFTGKEYESIMSSSESVAFGMGNSQKNQCQKAPGTILYNTKM